MKIRPLLLLAFAFPLPVHGQDTLAAKAAAEPPPPAGIAAAEASRSKRCVPLLARLDTLQTKLEPLARQADRLQALDQAILFEDSTKAAPFDARDSVEVAVRAWFAGDQALAKRYAESGDSALAAQRDAGRAQIRKRLGDAMAAVRARGQQTIAAAGDLELGARECQGMMLVRPAVLEACGGAGIPVCAAARDTARGRFRFVDRAEDMWDVESLTPWVQPQRLAPQPSGGLGGAKTEVVAQRGNLMVGLGLEPMIRDRAQIGAQDVATIEAGLDSLGIKYRNARYLLAPALAVELEVAEPLAGETRYFLHFGDLSNPAQDVIWSAPATGHPLQAQLPASKAILDRLAAGEPVSLTAVRFADAAQKQGSAVYSVDLTQVGQALAVANLLQYWQRDLGGDFDALVPAGAK